MLEYVQHFQDLTVMGKTLSGILDILQRFQIN